MGPSVGSEMGNQGGLARVDFHGRKTQSLHSQCTRWILRPLGYMGELGPFPTRATKRRWWCTNDQRWPRHIIMNKLRNHNEQRCRVIIVGTSTVHYHNITWIWPFTLSFSGRAFCWQYCIACYRRNCWFLMSLWASCLLEWKRCELRQTKLHTPLPCLHFHICANWSIMLTPICVAPVPHSFVCYYHYYCCPFACCCCTRFRNSCSSFSFSSCCAFRSNLAGW